MSIFSRLLNRFTSVFKCTWTYASGEWETSCGSYSAWGSSTDKYCRFCGREIVRPDASTAGKSGESEK